MKVFRKFLACVLCLSMLGIPAFAADTAEAMPRDTELMSRENVDTLNGVTYTAYASLYVGTRYRAGIWVTTDTTLAADTIKTRALLYNESGSLLANTSWISNEEGLTFGYAITSKVSSSSVVIAKGEYQVPSSNGPVPMETWYIDSDGNTFNSLSSRSIDSAAYPQTASGETYGSLLEADQIGSNPDLISAVGTDGTQGYIRAVDFYTSQSDTNLISLYDLSGNVIGQYELYAAVIEPETDPLVLEKIQKLTDDSASTAASVTALSDSKTVDTSTIPYQMTKDGQTYGSLLTADRVGYLPDLISAVGKNGLSGYLHRVDYCAASVSNSECPIPVYNLNGRVIDQYICNATPDLDGISFPK